MSATLVAIAAAAAATARLLLVLLEAQEQHWAAPFLLLLCTPQFCEQHLEHFSIEGLRYTLERQPAGVWQHLAALHKQRRRGAG